MGKLFGTDGIRGVANSYPVDVETSVAVGRAVARFFGSQNNADGMVVIGQDTRLSGDMIAQAVSAGLCSAGLNVSMLGVVPTPAVAFLTRKTNALAGVVISASHNPYADNGIKLFNSNGYKLDDDIEEKIEGLIGAKIDNAPTGQLGQIQPLDHANDQYLAFLKGVLPDLSMKGLKLVIDCSNGATYQIGPRLFQSMGADVVPLFCDPDGININDQCGSQHPETLAGQVVAQQADMGLAFDGDGDRLIAVDENGVVLTGDQIMAICAKDMQVKGRLKNNRVVTTVMSNMGFRIAMKEMGVELFTTQVGDRYVMHEMMAQEATLGGEDSGHMIFRDCHTTGDGIMAALRLIDAVQSAGSPMSELAKVMDVYPQVLINVDVQSKPELETKPEIMAAIEEVESRLGEQGRVLVRYSGTQPQCRVMVEGPTEDLTKQLCSKIAGVVKQQLS